jgi:hypothetical protein
MPPIRAVSRLELLFSANAVNATDGRDLGPWMGLPVDVIIDCHWPFNGAHLRMESRAVDVAALR